MPLDYVNDNMPDNIPPGNIINLYLLDQHGERVPTLSSGIIKFLKPKSSSG